LRDSVAEDGKQLTGMAFVNYVAIESAMFFTSKDTPRAE
jgi:hypothetical protein